MSSEQEVYNLADEQEEAVERILNMKERAIILTGCAGSGKSFVVKHLLSKYPTKFSVCSTTARSALLVGGCTVDRMFSFSRQTWEFRTSSLSKSMEQSNPYIIIDEASMVGKHMADLIAKAAQSFKKKVILVGDWAQAKPVKDKWPFASKLFDDVDVINLQVNHRQADGEYLDRLNEIRRGELTEEVETFFSGLEVGGDTEIPGAVKLFAVNSHVDEYNLKKLLDHVNGDKAMIVTADAAFKDQRAAQVQERYPFDTFRVNKILAECPLAHEESFAKGCRVMITHNIWNIEHGIIAANGDTGVLKTNPCECDGKSMKVLLDRTNKVVVVPEVRLMSKNPAGQVEYNVEGLPLRLGYAVSIHKSQGMTLLKVDVDLASILRHPEGSRHGLAYVALSRTTTAAGLTVRNWDSDVIRTDELVLPFIA